MKKKIHHLSLIICLVLSSLLTSCGFHLRGSIPLPKELKNLYIQSATPFGEFEQVLRDSLRSYNVNVLTDKTKAPIILNIVSASLAPITGSSNDTLSLQQYTLSYSVTFQVLSTQGVVIIPSESVSASTTFTSEMSQMMLSSKASTQQYLPGLQREVVFRMISRLLSTNSKKSLQQYFQKHHSESHENKT